MSECMWYKNFRFKKMQTALIAVILFLCSVLLAGSMQILSALQEPYKKLAEECEAASAMFYPADNAPEQIAQFTQDFQQLDVIERVELQKNYYIADEMSANGKQIHSYVHLTQFNKEIYGNVRIVKGTREELVDLKEGECFLPACIMNDNDLEVGDVFEIHRAQETLYYTIKGVYADIYDSSSSFDSNILVGTIPETLPTETVFFLYGKDDITGKQIEEAYRASHDNQMRGILNTKESITDNVLITANLVGAIFLALGGIMLVVSCLIINFMIRNTMITDAKTIAIYKTMGYSASDIMKLYLVFYFIIASIAVLGGIGGSVFLSNTILTSFFENIGTVARANVLAPAILCYVVTVGFVVIIIYGIISKTKHVKPVKALCGMSNTNTKKSKKYQGNSKIQFSSLGIALRNLRRNKKMALGIIAVSIVTIFGMNFASISLDVASNQRENNDYWIGIDPCDVMVGVTDETTLRQVEDRILSYDEVEACYGSNEDKKVSLDWKKGMNNAYMGVFVYDDYTKLNIPVEEGRNPQTAKEIAITSLMAKELQKQVGDYMEVWLSTDKKVEVLITGIFQTYYNLGNACRMTFATYEENQVECPYDTFSIYLKEGTDRTEFIQKLSGELGNMGKVIPRTQAFEAIMNMIVSPQQTAIPPVMVLALFIGGVNIFCIVLLQNSNNQKNNGIYKCIGYTTKHLVLANLWYVGLLAGIAVVVTVPAILLCYPKIMTAALTTFGMTSYPVTYNIVHIIMTNAAVLGIFVVSALISSRSLKTVNVRDLVQE